MTDELIPLQPTTEVAPEPFVVTPELQAALDEALATIRGRSFSERHPELGKMMNCPVCRTRHRVNEKKCEQKFTYRIGDYELYREDEQGELMPDYRTAVRPDEKPTKRQILGAAAFAKKRFHPHPSKIKLQFIERTRVVFARIGFYLLDQKSEKFKALKPDVQKAVLQYFEEDLQRARVLAAREIRRERELHDREIRRHQDQSRRINRGLLAH